VNKPDCKINDVNKYGPIIKVINIFLNEFLCFMNDQDKPKDNNPRIINVFSLLLKLSESLKKK
jgi:hypothetical protein